MNKTEKYLWICPLKSKGEGTELFPCISFCLKFLKSTVVNASKFKYEMSQKNIPLGDVS